MLFLIMLHLTHFNPRTLQESATRSHLPSLHYQLVISIHAPYKRVRPNQKQTLKFQLKFQSTHPTRECDNDVKQAERITLAISIHAPYKRVRRYYNKRGGRHLYFNPRTLQESATAF